MQDTMKKRLEDAIILQKKLEAQVIDTEKKASDKTAEGIAFYKSHSQVRKALLAEQTKKVEELQVIVNPVKKEVVK